MKLKSYLRKGLLLLLCVLLVACSAPELPEESSVSMEETEETEETEESAASAPVADDETVGIARAYLEELLASEQATKTVDWLTEERAEAIRESVKQLNAPFLTEEDVLCIAERALSIVISEQPQSLLLPACGVLATVVWSPMVNDRAGETFYAALIAYTLYLFTPPEYLFREEEVFEKTSLTSALRLYLPLAPPAGAYASRLEALAMLQEGKNMVELYLSGLAGDEHPLDCSLCGTPVLFRETGEALTLDLLELAEQRNVEIPEAFLIARAETYVREWLDGFLTLGVKLGIYGLYELPNGDNVIVSRLLAEETVQRIREMVELLSAPILTSDDVSDLAQSLLKTADSALTLLLPGVDGKEDVLLPPDVEAFEDALWQDGTILAAKAYAATVYLIDLFTPSAYRFTDLLGREGTYYALNDGEEPVYLLVAKENGMYVADSSGVRPLFITWIPWEV